MEVFLWLHVPEVNVVLWYIRARCMRTFGNKFLFSSWRRSVHRRQLASFIPSKAMTCRQPSCDTRLILLIEYRHCFNFKTVMMYYMILNSRIVTISRRSDCRSLLFAIAECQDFFIDTVKIGYRRLQPNEDGLRKSLSKHLGWKRTARYITKYGIC